MMLVSREDLRAFLSRLDGAIDRPADLMLVGGSAMLVLSDEAVATKDLDAFPTETLDVLIEALEGPGEVEWKLDLNTASAAFETYLPEDWQDRIKISREFSTEKIRISTPSPEDLAVMKIFRFAAKDADDIERLARTADFDADAFRERFTRTLPVAIGEPITHAMSFCLAWNALYPDQRIDFEDLLAECGL